MLTRGGEDTQASVELVAVAAFTFHHSPVFVHVTLITWQHVEDHELVQLQTVASWTTPRHGTVPDPINHICGKPLRFPNLQICINQIAINSLGLHCIIK